MCSSLENGRLARDDLVHHVAKDGLHVYISTESRPERHIQNVLSVNYPTTLRLIRSREGRSHPDIELFLRTESSGLARDRVELRNFVDWLPRAQIQTLTRRADGLFIYASTAMKYISDHRDNAKYSLAELTRLRTSTSSFWIRSIDEMYTFIFKQALPLFDPFSKSTCTS